jgi:hypothetical protein
VVLSRNVLLSATSVILALSGCQTTLPHSANVVAARVHVAESEDLYPLVTGRHWEYQLAQQQGDSPVQQKAMTIRIASTSEIAQGLTEAVLDREYGAFKPPSTRVRKNATSIVLSRLADPVDGPSITILRLPLTPGATWPGRDFGGGNTETIAPQGPESVTVPAGTFLAQRVDHHIHYAQGSEDVLNYWYAPGVGLVKMIERITLYQGDQPVHMVSTGTLNSVGTDPVAKISGNGDESRNTGRQAWDFLAWPGVSLPVPNRSGR